MKKILIVEDSPSSLLLLKKVALSNSKWVSSNYSLWKNLVFLNKGTLPNGTKLSYLWLILLAFSAF